MSGFPEIIFLYKGIKPDTGVNKTALWLCFKGAQKSLLWREA